MKKIILTLASLAIAVSSFAQVSVGLRAGGNYAGVRNVEKYQEFLTGIPGVYAGVAVQYSLDDVLLGFGIRGEVNYSMQGYQFKFTQYDKEKTTLNYINIPIMAEYSFFDGALSVMAGPQIGFNLGGTFKSVVEGGSASAKNKHSLDANTINTVDFGFALGLTYMFIDNLGIDLRYNPGMTNIFADGKEKNNVFSAGILYKF